MPNDTLMTVRGAANHIGVHENTLRRWEQKGLIAAVRLPTGTRRFRKADIESLRAAMYASPALHERPFEGPDRSRSETRAQDSS